jgi:hypothetical protein
MDQGTRRVPAKRSLTITERCSGTNTSCRTNDLLPVPRRPSTLPVIDDLDLGERHQQIGDRARVTLFAEKGADNRPLRIVAAARERVVPAQPPAAQHTPRGLARRQGA